MRHLCQTLGIVAVVGLLVAPLGTAAAEPLPGPEPGIPGFEGVCVEPEVVFFSMLDVVPFIVLGSDTLPTCLRACSMLGAACSAVMNTQLGCHSTTVTYGTIIAQTMCYALPYEFLLPCILDTYESASALRYDYEDTLEIRAACRELAKECSLDCGQQ